MPYIDITIANEELRKVRMSLKPVNDNYAMGFCEAIKRLNMLPAADVVSKSDVDEIKEEYERLKLEYAGFEAGVKHGIKMFKIKVAREIFEELERIGLVLPYDDYLELKNKYTEEYK